MNVIIYVALAIVDIVVTYTVDTSIVRPLLLFLEKIFQSKYKRKGSSLVMRDYRYLPHACTVRSYSYT